MTGWGAALDCPHRGVLGRDTTRAQWRHSGCGNAAEQINGWRLATVGLEPPILAALLRQARDDGLPVASALVRVATRHRLPDCSVLLTDGEDLAALAWGRPMYLLDLGGWEYVAAAEPPTDSPVDPDPLPARSVLALSPCGQTRFALHPPEIHS